MPASSSVLPSLRGGNTPRPPTCNISLTGREPKTCSSSFNPGARGFRFRIFLLVGYNLAFVLPFLVAPFALLGTMQPCRGACACFTDRIWLYLTARLLVYRLVWAKAAPTHGCYNLQNLVLFSALSELRVAQALRCVATRDVPAWMPSPRPCVGCADLVGLRVCALPLFDGRRPGDR